MATIYIIRFPCIIPYMNIAVISYHTCPLSDEKDADIGGLNTYVYELSRQMATQGHNIDIFTRLTDKNSPRIVNVQPNLRVIHIKAGKKNKKPTKKLLTYIPRFYKNLENFIQQEKLEYGLVSCHYYLSGLVGLKIKAKIKKPMIITFHTLALMKNLVAKNAAERESPKRIKAENLLMQKADKIIAISPMDAKYIANLYGASKDKIFVLTPGLDHNLFKPLQKNITKVKIGADPKFKLILFVGRIQPLKGIDTLLYALKILIDQAFRINVCLWVLGDDNLNGGAKELKRLQKLQTFLNLDPFVRFLGKKRYEQLPAFYNAADLVVMPSKYESFGMIALEAMACGVPVITTNATGVSDLYDKKHKNLIIPVGNPSLLAQKIERILTNENQYKKLSQQVLVKVKAFNWQSAAKDFQLMAKTLALPETTTFS